MSVYLSMREISKREIEVLQVVAADEANKEIGAQLSLSKDTMGKRVTNVMAKLRAEGLHACGHDRSEARNHRALMPLSHAQDRAR